MKTMQPFVLILIAQTCCAALLEAQSPNLIGRWNVEITFANGTTVHCALTLKAREKAVSCCFCPDRAWWSLPNLRR